MSRARLVHATVRLRPWDGAAGDLVNARGWLRELAQGETNGSYRRPQELLYGKTSIDRWIDGEYWLHIHIRLGTSPLDVDPRQFCAWLKNSPRPPQGHAPIDAIGLLADVEGGTVRDGLDELNDTVLIQVRQFVYGQERVAIEVPLSYDIRLTAPHLCQICASDSWELRVERPVELDPVVIDREVDLPLPPLREVRGSSPLVERPGERGPTRCGSSEWRLRGEVPSGQGRGSRPPQPRRRCSDA